MSQMRQNLNVRIQQHKNDGRRLEAENKTALTKNIHREGDRFNFENVMILDEEQHYFRRLIHISRNNKVNYMEDTNNLSAVYDHMIS